MKVKSVFVILFSMLLLMTAVIRAGAETIRYGTLEVDTEAEELDVGKTEIHNWDKFMDFLERLPRLKKVNLYNCYTNYNTVNALYERFPEIEFGLTLRIGELRVRNDITAFSTLHGTGDPTYGYKTLSQLKYCRNLKALDIGHNFVRNLDFLYEMPQLRVLIVAICDVEDITPIGSLKNLEYLEVFRNKVTDISCLAGLPRLLDLNIVENYISDLTPLTQIKTLKRLWIHDCNQKKRSEPTAETLQMLRSALPDCYIDAVSTNTGGGWREHPHFDVIYKMFRARTYIPFEDSWPDDETGN